MPVADAGGLQRIQRLVTLRKRDGVDMIDMPAMRGGAGDPASMLFQQADHNGRDGPACLRPLLDVVHLDVQNRALDTVHAIIVTRHDMIVFQLLPPIPQQARSVARVRLDW